MEWHDDGIVLSARKHGESSTIVNLLPREHGRHTGFVRGGAGRSARGIYQPGNGVSARWSARLPEHLGTFNCELTGAVAANLMADPLKLAGLSSACALIEMALPERERLVASLYYQDELTQREIAKVLGTSESRVCQLHARSLVRLNEEMRARSTESAA